MRLLRLDKIHMQKNQVVKQNKKELEPCVKSSRFVYVSEELWVFVCIMYVDCLACGKEL